ncbi:hypothetical protein QP028_12180 [Corynebacterium suedekumii]|nr:hypothetical protein QP028_12180 [Corynebacterium suedekumii]
MKSYSEQVAWLRDALAASYEAITGQNAFVARGMDIADEGGSVGNDSVAFPPRPAPRFENFSFMPPMVLPAVSIDMLSAEFSSTKIQGVGGCGQDVEAVVGAGDGHRGESSRGGG